MPMYSYACKACGRKQTLVRTIEKRHNAPRCQCGESTVKVLDAPRVVGDYAGYNCPVSGKWIEGRRAHEENLKRTGSRVLEPGETAQSRQRQAAEDSALEDRIGETAAELFTAMPQEKQEALARGFDNGLDVAITRN